MRRPLGRGPIGAILAALLLASAVPLVLQWSAAASAGDITTVAGSGGAGPATGVGQTPGGVAVAGDVVYVADTFYSVVRRIEGGIETIIAGDELAPALGDGGPARSAQLKSPSGVAVDAGGNLYIADRSNNRVRKVDPAGTITTLAGQGTAGYGGDGLDARLALLNTPSGVAVSGDSLYIADTANHRVRRVTLSTGVISTYAGLPLGAGGGATGGDGGQATAAQLASPSGVAVDGAGNLFIADTAHNVVRRVTLASGVITTVAGTPDASGFSGDGGQATAAKLNNPAAIAIDDGGSLLIADTMNHRVRRVDATTGLIATLAGVAVTASDHYGGDGGPATAAKLYQPRGVATTAGGSVLVADTGNSRVRTIDLAGGITTTAGAGEPSFGGEGRPAWEAQLRRPNGVVVAPDGTLYISDTANNRVRHVATDGTITTVAGTGGPRCPLPNDAVCGDGGRATDAQLTDPSRVAFGPDGLYITTNNRVRRIGADGTITTVVGTGLYGSGGDGGPATSAEMFQPAGMAFDADGNLFIADASNHRIRRVDAGSRIITTVAGGAPAPSVSTGDNIGDGGPATSAVLKNPSAVAVDRFGNLFVTDTSQQRVRLVVPGPDGAVNGAEGETITTVAGRATAVAVAPGADVGDGGTATAASLRAPAGLAFRGDSLLISDGGDHRVRQVAPGADGKVTGGDGETITTIAGTGMSGYAGDGAAATAARLSGPAAVDVAPDGQVLIADAGNHRIRAIQPEVPPFVPPTIVASGGGAQHTTIGTPFDVRLRATVRDSAGRPVPGVDVTFTAPATGPSGTFPGGTPSATSATDAFGTATAPTFTANDRAGSYQVAAAAPGVTGNAAYSLVNDHGPAATIAPTAGTPQSARVGTEFATRLVVTVVDSGGNPVPGTSVDFTAPDDEPSGAFDTPSGGTSRVITVATAEDGEATATAFLAGRQAGSYAVRAAVESVGEAAEFTLTNVAEHTPFVTAVAGTPQSTRVGSDFAVPLQAAVRDEADRPLVGVEVTFTAPGAGPSATFPGGSASAVATTDERGVASAPTLTANDAAGSWSASASVAGATSTATFSLTNTAPEPALVRAVGGTPQRTPAGSVFPDPLRALVRDDAERPMAGIQVAFTAPGAGPSATFPGGFASAVATTDERGVATAPTLTANGAAGSYAVVARVDGIAGEATFSLTNSPAGAAETDPVPPCPIASAGPGRVVYPAGFSLVGLPEGTRLPPSPARMWGWWDQGARGQYSAGPPDQPLAGGRGYWKYFACPTAVDLAPTPAGAQLAVALGAYHASIVGNPADRPVTVSGHDYASRYLRPTATSPGGYRMSGYREPVFLAPGEAVWVFAYRATTIRIEG